MFDIAYAIRILAIAWRHKRKGINRNIFDNFIVKGRCWPNDLDILWHMNNSRYLRDCDFGRYAFFIETGLANSLIQRRKYGMKDSNILVSALQVQYRQSIQLGDQFQVKTNLNGWDDNAFYFEQSIILDKNQKIAFLLLARIGLAPRSLTPQMLIDDLKIGSIQSPKLSPTVQIFKENYKLNLEHSKSKM